MKRVLVTGAVGQIGSELTTRLRKMLGGHRVVAAGHVKKATEQLLAAGPFHFIDCTRIDTIAELVTSYRIDTIYHLAAILSAAAEKNPQQAWRVNVSGLINVLEVAREHNCAVFVPSSIAAFGPSTPSSRAPQDTIQRPTTLYGVSKLTGELLCDYYFSKYGVDTRGVRYPGLISYKTAPSGGTTDYAVGIYFEAVRRQFYTCYLKPDTFLEMMYMPDALRAAIELMHADPAYLKHRNAYNIAAMNLSPAMIAAEIKKIIPGFSVAYVIDPMRQAIADSWPRSLDDSAAREEWGWRARYDLCTMSRDMIGHIKRMCTTAI
jgi:nucleoside-diphosphate-sugar epimerase